MLKKIYSGKNSDANFNGKRWGMCLISVVLLVSAQG